MLEPLRDYVRTSPHGVLVATGCLRAALHCGTDTPFRAARHGVFVPPASKDSGRLALWDGLPPRAVRKTTVSS